MDAIVTLTDLVPDDPLRALERPPSGPSLVEIRADLVPDLDLARAISLCPLPVLVTYRSQREGGRGSSDPETRRHVLRRAWESGAHLIDLELDRDLALIDELGIDPERIILSWHDPQQTPEDIFSVVRRALESRARWVKIVPTAQSLADLARILSVHTRFRSRSRREARLIAFAMGPSGVPSRYLSPLLNAPLTYVAWSRHAAAAPGQLTFEQLDGAIGHLSGPPRRLFGVVGANVTGSLSPQLHGAGYRAAQLPYAMLPFSVPDPAEARVLLGTGGAELFDESGLTLQALAVTRPYKGLALEQATIAAPRAWRARAANTLILKENQILADTTDADGIAGALIAAGLNPQGQTALIQGTGGAARGAAIGLDLAGAHVFLRGRDATRTAQVAREIQVHSCGPDDLPNGVTILVNATPLGSRHEDPSPFTGHEIAGRRAVVDMVYAAAQTHLESLATRAGVTYIGGRTVLFYQGISQFAAMTSHTPPREAMLASLSA